MQNQLEAARWRKTRVGIGIPIATVLLLAISVGTARESVRSFRSEKPIQEFHFEGIRCSEFQASMTQFAAKQLPPARHNQLNAHLQQCSACQAELNAMQATSTPIAKKQNRNNPAIRSQTHRSLLASNLD
ncbi:hypothetical protein RISK_000582 [Rhodopirellula islandica]|uniref:Putative zinc-finger domain-containing protein n=1 Tax=Rhodopirellula islandica TaxID=595434 RepID=A0A0J1EPV0_RHOIS|nr:hypothetical protein RISK_000582 [Rhodopirellula islandica]